MNNIHKLKFTFSSDFKGPLVPLLKSDDADFVASRNLEIDEFYSKLKSKLLNIDLTTNKGYGDLFTVTHLLEEVRRYNFSINRIVNKGKAYVPYTGSGKDFKSSISRDNVEKNREKVTIQINGEVTIYKDDDLNSAIQKAVYFLQQKDKGVFDE